MAREYVVRTKEEKLAIVKRNLAGETCRALAREIGCNQSQVLRWTNRYLAEGESGLELKKRPSDPLARYRHRKNFTYEEQLQYQIETLKKELIKKDAEVLRLKKQNERKGGDARKR